MANVKACLIYTIVGTLTAIFLGELMPIFIADNPVFLNYWLAIFLYYIVITLIFSLFIFRIPPLLILVVFFIYGLIMETLVFQNIHGLIDFPGILFFGNQYIALFGLPCLITKKILQK